MDPKIIKHMCLTLKEIQNRITIRNLITTILVINVMKEIIQREVTLLDRVQSKFKSRNSAKR